jgi:RNA polymerase sigma-70 factor (ECF subfamily)
MSTTTNITELIQVILKGDIDRFDELIDLYKNQVLKIVQKRIDYPSIEEVCQDCFIRIYQSLSKFSGKSPFENWVTRVTIRTCCDYWRKNYRSREVYTSSQLEEDQENLELYMIDLAKENHSRIQSLGDTKEMVGIALAKVRSQDRAILELVYLLGWTIKEVAAADGKSVTATKVRLMRARKKLRIEMEKLEGV